MRQRILLLGLALAIFAMNTGEVQAEPLFTDAECITIDNPDWNDNPTEPIWVYIEDDAGVEMSACHPTGHATKGISNTQFRNIVRGAMEIWNAQSLATPFLYGGYYHAEHIDDICSSLPNLPAVFVRFHKGCSPDGSGGCLDRIADVRTIGVSCDNAVHLNIYGDKNDTDGNGLLSTPTSNAQCNVNPILWSTAGSPTTSRDLMAVVVHELGHVHYLSHPNELTPNPVGQHSVMVNNYTNHTSRHLYPWDMDCVDDSHAGVTRGIRDARYYWRGIDSAGNWKNVESMTNDTTRSFTSGGSLLYNGGDFYGLYDSDEIDLNDEVWTDQVFTNGSFTFDQQPSYVSSLERLYIGPLFLTVEELVGPTNNDHRAYYAGKLPTVPGSYTYLDPPRIKYARSDNFFQAVSGGNVSVCESKTACSNAAPLQTNVPLSSAYDPYSDTTVYFHVETGAWQRGSTSRYAGHIGKIIPHPGHWGTSSNSLLRYAAETTSELTPPVDPYEDPGDPDYDYAIKTYAPVGVACAPDRDTFEYNCLHAWMDQGTNDGRILYAYFKVEPLLGEKIIKWQDEVWVRSGAYTNSGVQAAYFEGAFWMAWKTRDSTPDVEWTSNASINYYGWGGVQTNGRTKVLDPPTWLYTQSNNDERALVWTEWE